MSKYPSQMQDKFNLRFPDGMRDAIAKSAKKNGRSMNSEIIAALDSWLTDWSKVESWGDAHEIPEIQVLERLEAIEERLKKLTGD